MANFALFVGWGPIINGRERKALQVFGESLQYYARLQQQGEVESVEPVQLEPHGGDLSGFLFIKGDREKLNRLRYSDEFQHNLNRAILVVENVGVIGAFIGEDLNRVYANFGQQAQEFGG